MQTLNSPLEIGLRSLAVLTEVFPTSLDVDRLVLLDYCLLHSADFDGPVSIQPAISTRGGELGVKRSIVEHGVQLMRRAGMVDVVVSSDGITYRASESATPFLHLVQSSMLDRLRETAVWATVEFAHLSNDAIRARMRQITVQWTEEWTDGAPDDFASDRFAWSEGESTL